MSNFSERLTMSTFASLLLIGTLYFSYILSVKIMFIALAATVIVTALWEYYHISERSGSDPVGSVGITGSLCYLFILYVTAKRPEYCDIPLITLGLILFISFIFYFFSGKKPFANLAVTMFGIIYLTVPLGAII